MVSVGIGATSLPTAEHKIAHEECEVPGIYILYGHPRYTAIITCRRHIYHHHLPSSSAVVTPAAATSPASTYIYILSTTHTQHAQWAYPIQGDDSSDMDKWENTNIATTEAAAVQILRGQLVAFFKTS